MDIIGPEWVRERYTIEKIWQVLSKSSVPQYYATQGYIFNASFVTNNTIWLGSSWPESYHKNWARFNVCVKGCMMSNSTKVRGKAGLALFCCRLTALSWGVSLGHQNYSSFVWDPLTYSWKIVAGASLVVRWISSMFFYCSNVFLIKTSALRLLYGDFRLYTLQSYL